MPAWIVTDTEIAIERVFVHLTGRPGTNEEDGAATLCLKLTNAARAIGRGDSMWWSSEIAYWTSRHYTGPVHGGLSDGMGTLWDIQIPRYDAADKAPVAEFVPEFYMLYSPSGSAPTFKHSSHLSAAAEAARLIRNCGLSKVYVLAPIDEYEQAPIKHTDLTLPRE